MQFWGFLSWHCPLSFLQWYITIGRNLKLPRKYEAIKKYLLPSLFSRVLLMCRIAQIAMRYEIDDHKRYCLSCKKPELARDILKLVERRINPPIGYLRASTCCILLAVNHKSDSPVSSVVQQQRESEVY